jgi:hypothetical protein
MPLEITRSFVENRDGTYEPFHRRKDENEAFRKTDSQPLIKPLELKTFLKVGKSAVFKILEQYLLHGNILFENTNFVE